MITKETNIKECITKHPETVEVLMDSGIHCIGCVAANFETLEQGLKQHGMSEEEINEIIKRLNQSIKK